MSVTSVDRTILYEWIFENACILFHFGNLWLLNLPSLLCYRPCDKVDLKYFHDQRLNHCPAQHGAIGMTDATLREGDWSLQTSGPPGGWRFLQGQHQVQSEGALFTPPLPHWRGGGPQVDMAFIDQLLQRQEAMFWHMMETVMAGRCPSWRARSQWRWTRWGAPLSLTHGSPGGTHTSPCPGSAGNKWTSLPWPWSPTLPWTSSHWREGRPSLGTPAGS